MELASPLSVISAGIGIILFGFGLVKYFKQRAERSRRRREQQSSSDD